MRTLQLIPLTLALLLVPFGVAQVTQTRIVNDQPIQSGTAEAAIIDTRLFEPQIVDRAPWTGPVTLVRDHLPVHTRKSVRSAGAPNDLPVGGLLDVQRAVPMPTFPGIQQSPWSPPDPTIAVGPNHIVETVNMEIAFFNKDGQMTFQQRLDNTGNPGFFEELGAGDFTFDPKCYYDPIAERFVVLALEVYTPTESFITFAVSDDDDPNGIWYKYRTDSRVQIGSTMYWVDYPGLGFDDQGVYVCGNLFRLSGPGGGFGGVLFRAIEKAPLLNGSTAEYDDFLDTGGASAQSAQHYGLNNAPYFVSVDSSSSLRIYAITDPFVNPALVSTTVSVPGFGWPDSGAPNLGGGSLSVVDGRIFNAHWRDGELFCGHTVEASNRNQARWYHLNTGNWPDSGGVSFVQSGNIDAGSGVHTWFPAIAQNADGCVGMVVAMSSASTYASVQVTGREPGDPPGTMGTLSQIEIGSATYNGRWGDYFDITPDPVNDRTFWVVGEYAHSGGWGTAIGRFLVAPLVGDMNCDGTLDGADIDPFMVAIGDPDAYAAQFPQCDPIAADANEDGTVDGADIDRFFEILGGMP